MHVRRCSQENDETSSQLLFSVSPCLRGETDVGVAHFECAMYSDKAWPVYDFLDRAICCGGPCATKRPPSSPPSGPRSIIQSALRITSRLCSMMMMVLPRSVSR